jgi:hypothetical protein
VLPRPLRHVALFLFLTVVALAADLKVGSLNCYLYFDPDIDHRGKVDDANRMTAEQYRTKTANLATLTKGYDVVALQEAGGKAEVTALAIATRMSWAWSQGNDTATGQEVGLLYNLPAWTVTSKGRVAALDRVVSKHLLVLATHGNDRVYFLAVHLIRPIGAQADKHDKQRAAISEWLKEQVAREPAATVVVPGDTNNSNRAPLYGIGREVGELNGFAPTHLGGKAFDRLVVAGAGSWSAVEIRKPPYGTKPNDGNKRVWTDHYFVGATLRTGRQFYSFASHIAARSGSSNEDSCIAFSSFWKSKCHSSLPSMLDDRHRM